MAQTEANPEFEGLASVSKPWKEAGCCKACWEALEKRCKCRCNGRFHGAGRVRDNHKLDVEEAKT